MDGRTVTYPGRDVKTNELIGMVYQDIVDLAMKADREGTLA